MEVAAIFLLAPDADVRFCEDISLPVAMVYTTDVRYLILRDGPIVMYGNDIFLKLTIKMNVK